MDAKFIIETVFLTLLTVLGTSVALSLKSLRDNVSSLNTKVAVILTDLGHHKDEIERLDKRVNDIEGKI